MAPGGGGGIPNALPLDYLIGPAFPTGFDEGGLAARVHISYSFSYTYYREFGNFLNYLGQERYLGVSFEFEGDRHFGWIGIRVDQLNRLSGEITGYAFETISGRPIRAGQIVPEPSSLALLAAGAGGLLALRSARRPRRKKDRANQESTEGAAA